MKFTNDYYTNDYYWFLLSRFKGIGLKSLHKIKAFIDSNNMNIKEFFDECVNNFSSISKRFGDSFDKKLIDNINSFDYALSNNIYEKIKSDGINLISFENESYPKNVLKKMKNGAPPILFCKGYMHLLESNNIAIVGSRDAGESELENAKKISSELVLNGFNILSGYAKGVDLSAHLSALENDGTTTAILSYGFTNFLIRRELRNYKINNSMLFVSQFNEYEKFSGRNAMIRNKLVCSMSNAVIIIVSGPEKDHEGKMSGTFDAGKIALEMNIPLFVLGATFFKKYPIGNKELLKLGAIECNNISDIINKSDELRNKFDSTYMNKSNGNEQLKLSIN